MITLTLKIEPMSIIVYDGKLKGARLKYYAPGIEIYLLGAAPERRRDSINHIAMECAKAHHIPLISLKSLGWS